MPWRRVHGPQLGRGGPGAASDWLRAGAASFLRTCAVAPRRGHGGAGARWVPGRASQDRVHGGLRPRRRALRDGRGGAEAPPQRGTEPATQAPRAPPLLPGASRAARLRVRRSGHRSGCGRPVGSGLRGSPRAAAREPQTVELGGPHGVGRRGVPLPRRPGAQPALGDTTGLGGLRAGARGQVVSVLLQVRPAVRFSAGILVSNVFLRNCVQ